MNTGWGGGAHGTGKRISLKHTRAIIDAIHTGTLAKAKTRRDPVFGFDVITDCPDVPSEILVETTAKNSYPVGNESNGGRVLSTKSLRPLPMMRSNLL